jgi:hypothetical protein
MACWVADVQVTCDHEQSQRVTVDLIRNRRYAAPGTGHRRAEHATAGREADSDRPAQAGRADQAAVAVCRGRPGQALITGHHRAGVAGRPCWRP